MEENTREENIEDTDLAKRRDVVYLSMIDFTYDNLDLTELFERSQEFAIYDRITDFLTENFPKWRTEEGIGRNAVGYLTELLDDAEDFYLDEDSDNVILDENGKITNYEELQFAEIKETILNNYESNVSYYQHTRIEHYDNEIRISYSDEFLDENPDFYKSELDYYLKSDADTVTVSF